MPAPQHRPPLTHDVPSAQQLRVLPQPSEWPQPPLKSAQVFEVQATHALALHVSAPGHGEHDFSTPHPRSTGVHPETRPASIASAHVFGVQHALALQTSPVAHGAHDCWTPQPRFTALQPTAPASVVAAPASRASAHVVGVQQAPETQTSPELALGHVPQLTAGPQPFEGASPHVRLPQVGGVHGVHLPSTHDVVPVQVAGHAIVLLPHAFSTDPHLAPPSPRRHSGGSVAQTPPTQTPVVHVQ